MRNFFDQFDETTSTGGSSQKPSVNFFDQYDTPSVGQSKSPQEATDAMSVPDKFTRAGVKSVTSAASGLTNLAGKTIDGADPQKLAKLQQLISAVEERMGVDGSQYAPASNITGDSSKPIMERLANVPRSVVEMSAAPLVGLAAGGIPGAVSLTTASTAGPTIDRKREALGLRPDQDLPNKAKFEVGAKLGLDAALLAAGGQVTKGLLGPVEEAGIRGLAETSKRGLMATGADAAFGAQATAADKVLIEDKMPTVSDLTVGAAQGGLPGLVAHSPGIAMKVPGAVGEAGAAAGKAIRDPVVNRTFRPLESLEPQSRGRAADLIEEFSGNMGAAEDILKKDITRASKNLDDVIKEQVDKVKTAYDQKVAINPEWIDSIKEADPIVGRAVEDLTTFATMRDLKDNALYTKVKDINPLTNFKSRVTDYAIGHLFSPTLAKAIAAGETAIAGTAYGIDKFTGLSDPAKVIMDKYAGTADRLPTIAQARADANNLANTQRQFRTSADLYSASDGLNQAKAADKQSRDTIKAENALTRLKSQFQTAAANDARVEQKVQERANNNFWKEQRERLAIRTKSDIPASEYLGQDLGVSQNVPLAEMVSSDTKLALQTANLKKYLQDKRMSQLGKQANIMRNSQALAERQATAEQAATDQALLRQVNLMRNSQATEQVRQDALLGNVGQQNRIRIASEALAERQANAEQSAQEQAQAAAEAEAAANTPREYNIDDTDWGPSTSVKDRPEDVKALYDANKALLKSREKLQREEKRKQDAEDRKAKQAQEKKDREAKKLKDDETKAKAAKKVRDAEKKTEEAAKDADPEFYTFKYRGQQIRVPAESIEAPKQFEQSFKEKTDRRLDMLADAKALTEDKKVHKILDQLAKDWTDTTNDPSLAYDALEDVVNDKRIPQNIKNNLLDNWDSVKRTWATKRRSSTNTEDVDD